MPGVGADLYEVLSRIDLPIPGVDIVVGESVRTQGEFNLGLAASGDGERPRAFAEADVAEGDGRAGGDLRRDAVLPANRGVVRGGERPGASATWNAGVLGCEGGVAEDVLQCAEPAAGGEDGADGHNGAETEVSDGDERLLAAYRQP